MTSRIDLIAGLGNPGAEYAKTRHNVGFWFLDELARQHNLTFQSQSKFFGEATRLTGSNDCRLLKPTTFMNRSGQSVGAMASFFQIPVDRILVIHDELDLEPGTVRLKEDGGHGGHNGLRDISSRFGSGKYLRLRIGIGHPGNRNEVTNYVLGRPSKQDEDLILDSIQEALRLMPDILAGNLQNVMNELHRKKG